MRKMYDSVNAAAVPADGDLYAGYIDGGYRSWLPLTQRFPNKKVVKIAAFSWTPAAEVYDTEPGDLTPQQVVPTLQRERAAGRNPSIYCDRSERSQVEDLVAAAGLVQPPYWVAAPTQISHQEPGAVATQWGWDPGFDTSLVEDFWPGVDSPSPVGATLSCLSPAAQARAWIIEFWGREPSVDEQHFVEGYLAQNGDDLTIASLYDHANGAAFRARRGW